MPTPSANPAHTSPVTAAGEVCIEVPFSHRCAAEEFVRYIRTGELFSEFGGINIKLPSPIAPRLWAVRVVDTDGDQLTYEYAQWLSWWRWAHNESQRPSHIILDDTCIDVRFVNSELVDFLCGELAEGICTACLAQDLRA